MSDNERSDNENGDRLSGRRKLSSVVWDHFTIIDRKNHVAECNVCFKRLSFKTTVTNLKKHVIRKHASSGEYPEVSFRERTSFQRERRQNKPFEIRNTKLTELGGLEGLILNVIGEDGNINHEENQEENNDAEDNDHNETDNQEKSHASKSQREANRDPAEKKRQSRLMELQLECLEIKKYNMQLESLMLEQQLNIRRSIFTETLQYADTLTRGTQTDVGGENTRVFYIADSNGGIPRRHLFAMHEVE